MRLESAATANFIVHASWAASRCADARVETGPELTVVDSGLGVDTFNIVCGARLTPEDVSERARRVREYFASVARPFSWWVAPGDEPSDLGARLAREGLSRVESEVAMAATLAPGFAGEVEVARGLQIVRAETPAQLDEFARINAENWSPPDTVVEAYYRRSAGALLSTASPQRFYIATLGGSSVAALEATLAAGVVGIYNLSTRSAYRRRGVASFLLLGVLKQALGEGVRTAVLQATASGAGLYRRLGFEQLGVITEHKPAQNCSVR